MANNQRGRRGGLDKARHIVPTVLLVRVQCFRKSLYKAVQGPSTRPIVLSMINGSYCRRRRRLTIFEPDEMNTTLRISRLSCVTCHVPKYIHPDSFLRHPQNHSIRWLYVSYMQLSSPDNSSLWFSPSAQHAHFSFQVITYPLRTARLAFHSFNIHVIIVSDDVEIKLVFPSFFLQWRERFSLLKRFSRIYDFFFS